MNDDELISPLTPEELCITAINKQRRSIILIKFDTLVKMIASPE
jgi:hypothetical protein